MNEWISVKERLPKDFKKDNAFYLVCTKDDTLMSTVFYSDKVWIMIDGYAKVNDVLYWMPLPQPPKE